TLLLYDWRPGWLFRPETADLTHDSTRVRARQSSFAATVRGLAVAGLPLGLAQMLNSLSVNVPRYFLDRHAGEASLGIFAAIMYLLVVGRIVMAALAQSCLARLARFYADGDRKAFQALIFKQIGLALGFGAAGIIFSVLCGGTFLRLAYGREYAHYTGVLLL